MSKETDEHREQRIRQLWNQLDTRSQGEVDLDGLKRGLAKMDHPLKNADALLQDLLEAVDTSGDGRIQFDEFMVFVQHAEKELEELFDNIDRDHNGKLDKGELRAAFKRSGVVVSSQKLDQFFDEVDTDHDGEINFEEWRNFLLFIPSDTHSLQTVLSYYSAATNLNSEGDVHFNETLNGVGPREDDEDFDEDEDEEEDSQTSGMLTAFFPPLGYFIAGGLAGMISRTATAPLDRLKVYLIAQTSPKQDAIKAAQQGSPIRAARHFGQPLIDACKDLWRAGGIRSLFAGNGLNVVKVMPESAIKFGAYEASKRFFARLEGSDPRHLHPTSQFLAGGMGGVISQCVVYPLDTLKFRMQCEIVEGGLQGNALIMQTAKKMWHQGKFLPYYRGLGMGLAGMFPYSAIDLFIFENCKQFVLVRKAKQQMVHEEDVVMGNVTTAAIGASSGAISATVVYPINLLRTRLQAQGTVLHKPTYTGIIDVTVKTIQGEGFKGLFKGVTPNLLKVAPAVNDQSVDLEPSSSSASKKAAVDLGSGAAGHVAVMKADPVDRIKGQESRSYLGVFKMLLFRLAGLLCVFQLARHAVGLAVGSKSVSVIARQETGQPLQDLVTWDNKSLSVRGERIIFYSGEFHPFRLPVADLWLDVFQKVKALGYNGVSFYVNWALVEGTEGTIRTDGIFALEPFFDAASQAGIYLLARPGPYINAEVSGGGFPGWLGRINGTLRTNATDFLSATDLYIRTIGEKIAQAQITNGGPIILYQVENEYTYPAGDIIFPNLDYFDYVINQAIDAGIKVPIINNDAGPSGYFAPGNPEYGNVTVDIYGHDSYPLGFDCSNPYNWPAGKLPTNFRQLHNEQSPSTPYSIIEFQGGSFDPWGGPGFGQCNKLISSDFERVFYKNNWAAGVTMYNQYMIFGGTNWGNLGHPGGYTSYDYAAVIAEDRSVAREKFSEGKLQANFLKVTPSYLTSTPRPQYINDTYADTDAIATTPLMDTVSDTALYIVRHSDYSTNDSTTYTFTVPTSIGNVTIPQLSNFSSSLTLNGRDSKVHVTDYNVSNINLIYSSAEIFTWSTYDNDTILVLYGGANETHEFALPSTLGQYSINGSSIAAQTMGTAVVVQWQVTPEQQTFIIGSLTVYLLWRNDAYNWWTTELPAEEPVSNFSLPSKQSVIVRGPYLLRTAEITDGDLYLGGEINATTTVEVIGSPSYNNIFFNNVQLNATGNMAMIDYVVPEIDIPDISNLTWRAVDTLPELSAEYSDAAWPDANHTSTNNPLQPTSEYVLYASDYGFHTGPVLYRGHFISPAGNTSATLDLLTQGGYAYGYQVYLNSTLVHSYPGISTAQNNTATISLPALEPSSPYTLTVIVDHTGLTENFNPGADTMKQPRGILSYNLTTASSPSSDPTPISIRWKLTGNLGGESYQDLTRGPLNEGGLFFERQGYHLPGAPTNSSTWTSVPGGPVTGLSSSPAVFYATTFPLSLPRTSHDIPLQFTFANTTAAAPVRANLYVNGFQFGRFFGAIGPQLVFPVPEGVLDYAGQNYVGVSLWGFRDNDDGGPAKLDGLRLELGATPAYFGPPGSRPVTVRKSFGPADGWKPRDGAY